MPRNKVIKVQGHILEEDLRYKLNEDILELLSSYLGLPNGIVTHAIVVLDNNDITEVTITIAL